MISQCTEDGHPTNPACLMGTVSAAARCGAVLAGLVHRIITRVGVAYLSRRWYVGLAALAGSFPFHLNGLSEVAAEVSSPLDLFDFVLDLQNRLRGFQEHLV